MDHPYIGLEDKAFWRASISDVNALHISNIFTPKFEISKTDAICAAGSCFAQHIGRKFKEWGFKFIDMEVAPRFMDPADLEKFGYGMYSARYGNIYSVRQLLQMFQRADGSFVPEELYWETKGRFYDPFRPSIEPNGFESIRELELDIAFHQTQINRMLGNTDLFVFTFGLTEGWVNNSDGSVLPTCPGTLAGEYDDTKYSFHNFTHSEVLADTEKFIRYATKRNPNMKFLFTVSPVPLTATASGQHVLPATVYSKSVLRGVCGELYEKYDNVDYFPSYELVSSHPMRAMFFNPNLRTVSKLGVEHVMGAFLESIGGTKDFHESEGGTIAIPEERTEEDVACDELILQEFGN